MNPELILVSVIIVTLFALIGLLFMFKKRGKKKISSLKSGSLFDNYEIVRFIKRGGMATVFEAKNVKTKEIVALKIMHESLMDDDDLVDKFLREGDILEKLNRKYPDAPIVKVFRHSRENNDINGRPFLALEFVNGIDLDNLLANTKPNVNQSIKIVSNILLALKSAHNEGILHRDISPGNIIVDFENGELTQVKMIDFGVAKNEYMNKNTPDSSIHGKPPFMSPEQCRNEKLDKRSDIYSLGILFYTLLVGQPPFLSKNPLEVMSMHQTNEYPPLPEGISKPIREMIKNLLEKDIISRYQSAEEVIDDLKSIDSGFTKDFSFDIKVSDETLIPEVSQKLSANIGVTENSIKTQKRHKILPAFVILIFLLLAVSGYFTFDELNNKNNLIIVRNNDQLTKVVKELREYDIDIRYIFKNVEKDKVGKVLKGFVINPSEIKNEYANILVGVNYEE